MRLTFDLEANAAHNMLSVAGFLCALQRTLRVCRRGLLWCGTPCRSFTWVSTSRHKRSRTNPFGNTGLSFVQIGNILASRSVLLSLVALARGAEFFTEQPSGSQMDVFPYMEWLIALNIRMGTYLNVYTVKWPFR